MIDNLVEQRFARRAGFARVGTRFLEQPLVRGHLGGLEDERRVSGRVFRRVFLQAGKISGIAVVFGELLELVELCRRGSFGFHFIKFCNWAPNLGSFLSYTND